jgi:ELWxxDGT repeat protein
MQFPPLFRSRSLRAAWFLAWLLPAAPLAVAQPVPVTDVFPAGGKPVALNGSLYFAASAAATGLELWASTPAGTDFRLVKDIVPGPGHTNPTHLTRAGTALFFVSGNRLYKSDGTATGTVLLKTFAYGITELTDVSGTLYFVSDSGGNGPELWKSNGTAAGTTLVKDIRPGANGSYPTDLANGNGTLYFAANDGTHGTELWKSNGTAAGTVMIKDIEEGADGSEPAGMTAYNGQVFFRAGTSYNGFEPWVSDGTAAGTSLIEDLREGHYPGEFPPELNPPYSSYPRNFTVSSGALYFTAYPNIGNVERVFRIGGTGDSPRDVGGASAARYGASASITQVTEVNGALYYSTRSSAYPYRGASNRLYKLSGTTNTLLRDFSLGDEGDEVNQFTVAGGVLYLVANDGRNGREIWRSDGTPAGTVMLPEVVVGPGSGGPINLFSVGNVLYFHPAALSADPGLWKYDLARPQPTAIRLNAGGPAHTVEEYPENYDAPVPTDYFRADAYFSGGTAATPGLDVQYQFDPVLYHTERRGELGYNLPTPRGRYRVILHFAEVYWGNRAAGGAGSRRFHVDMEGVRRLTNYDIFAQAGGALRAVRDTVELDVLDGTLNIRFLKGAADQPKVCALEILPVTPLNWPPRLAEIGNQTLTVGQVLRFTALATDVEGNALTYSLVDAPAGATINPLTGAFTWTPTQPGTYTVTVRVTDNSYAQHTDEEKITVTVKPGDVLTYRVNAGGDGFSTLDARSFTGDAYFSGGGVSAATARDIAGTGDDYLYQTGRHGASFSYNLPLGFGTYDVVLHFAETYYGNVAPGGAGSRKFHVNMEGQRKLTDYDIFARAGGALRVAQETFRVGVADGTLNISFLKGAADNPAIKAIEVLPAGRGLTVNAGGAAYTTSGGTRFSSDVYYLQRDAALCRNLLGQPGDGRGGFA